MLDKLTVPGTVEYMEFIMAKDVAALLGIDSQTVYKLTREGRLPHVKLGRQYRYRREAILNWARQQEATAA